MSDTVEMSVDDRELDFRGVQQAAQQLGPVMQRAADKLVLDYRGHIDAGRNRSGGFTPLTPAYAARKAREHPGKPIMRATDEFYDSIAPRHDDSSASATTPKQYGFYQSGRRPHWISPSLADEIEDEVGDQIEGAWISGRSGLVSI